MKNFLFFLIVMFALNFSSCVRVTYYDGDKKEQVKQKRELTQSEKEQAEKGKIVFGIMMLVIFGPIAALVIFSDDSGPSGGPAG